MMNLPSLSAGSRVAVVGSRSFPSPSLVEAFISSLPPGVVVVSGGARGADSFAAAAAAAACLACEVFAADWRRYGRGAGCVRNAALVSAGLALLVAFVSDPSALSSGSADVIKRARAAGVPVLVFGPDSSFS